MDTLSIKTIPINSLLLVPEANRSAYIQTTLTLHKKVQDILFSHDTGSFIRGMAKSYDVDITLSPNIALAILFVAIGEKSFIDLPAIFSTELGLSADKAQKMTAEIEKDIFGPVKREWKEFIQGKKGILDKEEQPRATPIARPSSLPSNLLNLKEIAAAKRQEQLAGKPPQKQLPKRQASQRISAPTQPRAPLPRAPHPSPLPEQERGATAPAPTFPLPPRTPPLPPKPSVTPIDFSTF